jgi:hypothetical protein
VLAGDPQGRVAEFDGDGLAGVAEAGLDALAGDLDAAAAGDLPLAVPLAGGAAWGWGQAGPEGLALRYEREPVRGDV